MGKKFSVQTVLMLVLCESGGGSDFAASQDNVGASSGVGQGQATPSLNKPHSLAVHVAPASQGLRSKSNSIHDVIKANVFAHAQKGMY